LVPSESAGISIEIPASQGENAEASTAVISQPMTTSSADGARIAVPNRPSFELFGSTLFDRSSADIDASRRRHEYCTVATTLQALHGKSIATRVNQANDISRLALYHS
jgi:hypothetical protein